MKLSISLLIFLLSASLYGELMMSDATYNSIKGTGDCYFLKIIDGNRALTQEAINRTNSSSSSSSSNDSSYSSEEELSQLIDLTLSAGSSLPDSSIIEAGDWSFEEGASSFETLTSNAWNQLKFDDLLEDFSLTANISGSGSNFRAITFEDAVTNEQFQVQVYPTKVAYTNPSVPGGVSEVELPEGTDFNDFDLSMTVDATGSLDISIDGTLVGSAPETTVNSKYVRLMSGDPNVLYSDFSVTESE